MRKGRDGGKTGKTGKKRKKKILMKIVATTSLPAVDRPNADRWNAARSRQLIDTTYLSNDCAWEDICAGKNESSNQHVLEKLFLLKVQTVKICNFL